MSELSPSGGSEGYGACGDDAPATFRKRSRLSQHISFLKDFFRAYKDFSDPHIDTIELMLERMYAGRGISDDTDFSSLKSEDYPVLSDLYEVMENAYQNYDAAVHPLYTKELLQEILLGLRSMCVGAESVFFNGHTNITSDRFLVFGVKNLDKGNTRVKDALLFNVLSYLSDRLLTEGNTVATLDELYIWLSSRMTVEYIRNMLKRVRKKNSSLGGFRRAERARNDAPPLRHPYAYVHLQLREHRQALLYGQPADRRVGVRAHQGPEQGRVLLQMRCRAVPPACPRAGV